MSMKTIGIFTLILMALSCSVEKQKNSEPDFRNFYGIAWDGKPADNLTYAKQMGYDYIIYAGGMENEENATNIRFYFESPEYMVYPRYVDRNKEYSLEEQQQMSSFCVLKDASLPFPDNLATGWFTSPDRFNIIADFQQQKVIDEVIESILKKVKEMERPEKGFIFGGFAWDVPQLTGDFFDKQQSLGGSQRTLAYWRGVDSGDLYPGNTHQYATHSEGRAVFYKTLYKKTKEKYPDAKFILEPWRIYEEWLEGIMLRNDTIELIPDLLLQEKPGLEFITDNRIYKSALVDYNMVGSTTPNIFGENKNRETAAIAAIHGANFGWFGRFGGTGDMPRFKNVYDVPARLLLVRVITAWENKNGTPLNERKWSEGIYTSPTAYIAKDVIYARQPDTGKIFVVFNHENGKARFDLWKKGMKVYRTNDMLIEEEIAENDIDISNQTIRLKNASRVGKAYIIKMPQL